MTERDTEALVSWLRRIADENWHAEEAATAADLIETQAARIKALENALQAIVDSSPIMLDGVRSYSRDNLHDAIDGMKAIARSVLGSAS